MSVFKFLIDPSFQGANRLFFHCFKIKEIERFTQNIKYQK